MDDHNKMDPIYIVVWGGAATIDRTNILRGGMGESNERIRSILRGMGRSRNDSNELMSYGYITQIDILSEIQNRD